MIEFWYWLILAVVLMAAEIFAPGVFLLWLGVAALVTGAVAYFDPALSWQIQLAIFAVLSVAAVVGAWRWVHGRPIQSDRPTLNLRGMRYVGRILELEGPIHNGEGRARVGDSLWRVAGPDMPAGANVRVTGVDGTVLTVEPAELPSTEAVHH